MHLKKLTVENFKGFSKVIAGELLQFTLIVGKNDAGKSSLLEAIFLILGPANPQLFVNINFFRNIQVTTPGFLTLNFHNLSARNPITIIGDFTSPTESRKLQISKVPLSVFDSSRNDVINIEQTVNSESKSGSLSGNITLEYKFSQSGAGRPDIVNHLRMLNGQLQMNMNLAHEDSLRGVFIYGTSNPQEVLTRVSSAIINKKLHDIITVLRKIEPNLEAISIGSDGNVFADVGLQSMIPVKSLGDGFYRVLYYLSTIVDHEDGIVVIDEIESGLHFTAIDIMWDAVFLLAKKYNVQIISSTHSDECIASFLKAYDSVKNNERVLLRVERLKNATEIITYPSEIAYLSIENNLEIR